MSSVFCSVVTGENCLLASLDATLGATACCVVEYIKLDDDSPMPSLDWLRGFPKFAPSPVPFFSANHGTFVEGESCSPDWFGHGLGGSIGLDHGTGDGKSAVKASDEFVRFRECFRKSSLGGGVSVSEPAEPARLLFATCVERGSISIFSIVDRFEADSIVCAGGADIGC